MRTSVIFGAKNLGFFKIMVCPHRQGRREFHPGRPFFGQGEGQVFAILCGSLLWTVP